MGFSLVRSFFFFFFSHLAPQNTQLISTWFKHRRGVALGTIIGGLALGSALPHLIVGAGGVGDRWRIVTVRTGEGGKKNKNLLNL